MNRPVLRAGVMGWPVAHSKSPRLHGHWLEKYGVAGEYVRVPSPPGTFSSDLRKLTEDGWRGVNVTLPHKLEALSLADESTDRARAIGAANMISMANDGRLLADNTDCFGFIENIRNGAPRWSPDRPAFVFGAGGGARAVIWALLDAGAPEIRIANRTRARADALTGAFGSRLRVHDWNNVGSALAEVGLIANTTSLGMAGNPPLTVDFSAAPDDAVATDIVYTPLETPFLAAAGARGLATVDGLGMLLHQARPAFAAWFGVEPEVDRAVRDLMLAP